MRDDRNNKHFKQLTRVFTRHPASIGESYFQHLCFAAHIGGRLFAAGSAALIHALVPALFTNTASRLVDTVIQDMQHRHADEQPE